MQNETTPKYDVMLEKINQTLACMESDKLSIEDLSQKLEEAYTLIENLKKQLFTAEKQVEQIINSRTLSKEI